MYTADARINLCDRELLFYYYVKSPVRYACQRVFSLFPAEPIIPTHETIHVDVLDRPKEGVVFPEARNLVQGAVWSLAEKGEYLFLRIKSPMVEGASMEAVLALKKKRVKVFVGTPWVAQKSFSSAWNLLFQIVFRASLDPERELFVRGLGLLVKNKGFLVGAEPHNSSRIILNSLAERFPSLGEDRLLVRKEKDGVYIYATPWTRSINASRSANARLNKLVYFNGGTALSRNEIFSHFGSAVADGLPENKSSRTPLDEFEAFTLRINHPEYLALELERLALEQ